MGLKKLRRWVVSLARKGGIGIVESTFGGLPAWDISFTFHHRLNPSMLIGIGTPIPPGLPQGLATPTLVPPHPWVTLRANVWVSQLRYTLQQVSLDLRVRERTNSLRLQFELKLSRYGERVTVRMPCTAMR